MLQRICKYICLLTSIIVFCSLSVPVFAALGDVTTVQSPLSRPEVSVVTSGSSSTYTCAFMRQTDTAPSNEAPAGSYLTIITFTIPSSMDVIFYPRNYNSWFLWVAAPMYYEGDVFDIETGYLIEHFRWNSREDSSHAPDSVHTYYISPREGYYPSQTVYNSHLLGAYWYLPPEVQIKSGSSQGYYADWVQWSVAPLDSHLLHSFTSEPVYDYLNRYIVLGSQSDGYIYHLGYYAPQLAAYTESHGSDAATISNTTITYDYFFAPQLTLTDSGLSLSLHVNPELYQFWTQINSGGILTDYEVMISKYRLSDGQYVGSSLFTGSVDHDTSLSYSFGSVGDFQSIKTYGVHYKDESTSRHFNMLSCLWSYDPDFASWRASISGDLQSILSVLRGDGVQPSLPSDQEVGSNVDEYVSAEGDIIGRMDSVNSDLDNVFDDASDGLSDNASGFGFIKHLMEMFVFNISPLYIVVFFSLTFGVIVMIIGRSLR